MSELKQTPLHHIHLKLGAKMVPFAGYDMPVSYQGIQAEHLMVREKAGLFDVSHMGNFLITGPDAAKFLDEVTVGNATDLGTGKVLYSAMCYPNGTVVDDILIYRISETQYQMVVNASNKEKDKNWLLQHIPESVELEDRSDRMGIIAVQGPLAVSLVQKLWPETLNTSVFSFVILADGTTMSRTGYTGEDGFEIYADHGLLESIWMKLLNSSDQISPIGLGARDTLRLEAGLSLYGQELNEDVTLLESGLAWIVDFKKSNFLGKSALMQQKSEGMSRKLVGIEILDKAIPRHGYFLENSAGEVIGEVTSGSLTPYLKKPIAMALIQSSYTKLGTEVFLNVRNQPKKAVVCSRRFFQRNIKAIS